MSNLVVSEKPTLHPQFVENMVRTFNDSDEHGVHLLFNEWWAKALAEPKPFGSLIRNAAGSVISIRPLKSRTEKPAGRAFFFPSCLPFRPGWLGRRSTGGCKR